MDYFGKKWVGHILGAFFANSSRHYASDVIIATDFVLNFQQDSWR
jgi:hypothetical protein